MIPRSTVTGVRWPAVPDGPGAALLAMQFQLAESERLPPADIERLQLDQLARLLEHAARTVPFYRRDPQYAKVASLPLLTAELWRTLPILTRPELQESAVAMRSDAAPADHQPFGEIITTGSTGRPVRGVTTAVTRALWLAITVREILWHRRDMSGKLAAIRADRSEAIPPGGLRLPNWGPRIAAAFETGPCSVLGIDHEVKDQAEWLIDEDPDYLLTYPSNVMALARHFEETGARLPRLREVSTYGETLGPEVREACLGVWNVEVVDMYSAQELGYIALQCPASRRYHIQSEVVRVELLDDDGAPCEPGQVGRVIVTPLHNYGQPLVRYEIGDYAMAGEPGCECGRGLPVIERITGRQRNMWTLPSGGRVWPMFSSSVWGHLSAIRQLQLVQHRLDHIEARMVGPRPLTETEEAEFTSLLRNQFDFPFELTLTHMGEIDRTRDRKFEDFVSLLEPSAPA